MLSEESVKLYFLVTFNNIIISYIFPENFIEVYQVSENISLILTMFIIFMIFYPLLAIKKLMTSASIRE